MVMLFISFLGVFVWYLILIIWDFEKNEWREISFGWFNYLLIVINISFLRFLKDLLNLMYCFYLNIKIKYIYKKLLCIGVKFWYYFKLVLFCWMFYKYVMYLIWEFWWRVDILGFKSDLGNKLWEK